MDNFTKKTSENEIVYAPLRGHPRSTACTIHMHNGSIFDQNINPNKIKTFFEYTLGLSMPIFKKKSPQRFLGKSSKLWVLHKNSFLCNTHSLELFPRNLHKDFQQKAQRFASLL